MRKILAVALALMMAVLPVCSLADTTQYALSFTAPTEYWSGISEEYGEIIANVLNGLTLTLNAGDESAVSAAATLNGSDLLSLQAVADDERLYIDSNLLENPVCLTASNLEDLFISLICQSMSSVSEDQIRSLMEIFTAFAGETGEQDETAVDVTDWTAVAQAISDGFDQEKAAALLQELQADLTDMTTEAYDGTFFAGAVTVNYYTLTSAQMVSLLDKAIELVSGNAVLMSLLASADSTVSWETVMSQLREELAASEGIPSVKICEYGDESKDAVAYALIVGDGDESEATMVYISDNIMADAAQYTVGLNITGVSVGTLVYTQSADTFSIAVNYNGEEMARFDVVTGEGSNWSASLHISSYFVSLTAVEGAWRLSFGTTTDGEDAEEAACTVYQMENGADIDLAVISGGAEFSLLTIHYTAGAVDAPAADIDTASAVDITAMSADELSEYLEAAEEYASSMLTVAAMTILFQ